jgi:hypothetical protein
MTAYYQDIDLDVIGAVRIGRVSVGHPDLVGSIHFCRILIRNLVPDLNSTLTSYTYFFFNVSFQQFL